MLVLDAATSCNTPAAAAAASRLGDGSACPHSFVSNAALLRWLRPLLVAQGKTGGGAEARGEARIVGVTGPLHWLASVHDTRHDSAGQADEAAGEAAGGSAGGGGGGGVWNALQEAREVLLGLWQQQVEGAVGREPYAALGRLLFPFELSRQWRQELQGPTEGVRHLHISAVGLGLVRSWEGAGWWLHGADGIPSGDAGGGSGWEALVGA